MHGTRYMLRRIAYLTDVEGDMAYLERFVSISQAVRWEQRASGEAISPYASPSSHTDSTSPSPRTSTFTVADLREWCQLGFTDDTAEFVYGGDAFDHGPDLSVAQALLDFKQRYPDRVHLILGNRDLNKMVMAPMAALSGALQTCTTPFAQDMSLDQQGEFLFPTALHVKRPEGVRSVSYSQFLASAGVPPSPVTLVKWALHFRMGSPNAFEHRRKELARLRADGQHALVEELVRSPFLKPPSALVPEKPDSSASAADGVSDSEVASSFFRAAQPGGAYYEYMRHGLLTRCVGGILFVHGGLTEGNLGVIPSTSIDVPEADWRRVGPLAEPSNASDMSTDALDWLAALETFKAVCWDQWDRFWWSAPPPSSSSEKEKNATTAVALGACEVRTLSGEALRTYVYPREVVPYSITVASPVHQDGPSFTPLPVVHYLLSSGLRIVCAGHQPSGELPAVVRQPPADCFFTIAGDNSYCGHARAEHLCTPDNQRAKAVSEILFTLDEGFVSRILLHGCDALGNPFEFDVTDDPLVGTGLPDHWWVRSCHRVTPEVRDTPDGHLDSDVAYDLVRSVDGFRTVSCCTLPAEALRERCAEAARQRGQDRAHQVGGALKDLYTKAELAQVHVHRIKTKVTPGKTN